MKKKILIVNWGTKDKTYVFDMVKKHHYDIFLATNTNYPNWVNKYVSPDHCIITNTYDGETLTIDVIRYLHSHHLKLDLVTTFFEMNLIQTADLAAALHLPFINPGAARRSSNNKLTMRYACLQHHLPTPQFGTFTNLNEGLSLLTSFNGPVVIKPIKSGHSYGVAKIEGDTQEERAFHFTRQFPIARQQLDANLDEWMNYWPYKDYFLMEEFLEGQVISVDGLVQNHHLVFVGTASFNLSPPPLMLEQQTNIPAILSLSDTKACLTMTKKVIQALDLNDCGFHCELKLTSTGPVLLEIAARLPGGQMLLGYQAAYGVDLGSRLLDILNQKEISVYSRRPHAFVLQESIPFATTTDEVVTQVRGLTQLKHLPKFQLFSVCHPNDHTILQGGVPAPQLYYQIVASTRKKITQLQTNIHQRFQVKTLPSPSPNFLHKTYRIIMHKYRQFIHLF